MVSLLPLPLPLLLLVIGALALPFEDPVFDAAYQGAELSDAFSALRYIGNGVVLAGKRSSTPGSRIFRSTKYGADGSWASVGEIEGYTGAHTYWFGSHEGVVVTGTGDTGNVCMMRSSDWGATWRVILNSTEIDALAGSVDPGAVFSPLHTGNGRWIACLRSSKPGYHIIESTDDGETWHHLGASGLVAGARKMILTKDGKTILYGGAFADKGAAGNTGLFISRDLGLTWESHLLSEQIFSGLEDCGNGTYLVGTYQSGKTAIPTISHSRSRNVAIVITRLKHGLTTGTHIGLYTMGDGSFDIRPDAEVSVVNETTFTYANPGPDVPETPDTTGRVNYAADQKIFRSTDYGKTWAQVATTTVYSALTYIRSIIHIGDGLVYAYACANENSWADRALRYYKSTNYGLTWSLMGNQYTGPYGPLNAIYEATVVEGKSIVAATQPDSAILIADLIPLA
eukprot:TRINITY_DN2814_c0_g1_i1.p1 TRINITY_DN2814_c0_g1~~TRINITY_DN2814_c0_g1_i1.p1  ORF type:complete len:455 (+),score=86.42 TRINITY_DN2814_c0_g1_i1:454-1818(+)